jgi:hypothetical protein
MFIDLTGNSKRSSKEAVGTEVVAPLWRARANADSSTSISQAKSVKSDKKTTKRY